MTNEKARDFFSAYYEGTLEPGLSVSFEQKLNTDNRLSGDYRDFVEAMEGLDLLKLEEIAVPADLGERIAARLDRSIYDRRRQSAPVWSAWLRHAAFAGLAGVAIVGALISLNGRGDVPQAGALAPTVERTRFAVTGDGVTFNYAPSGAKTLVVTSATGKELERHVVGNEALPEFKGLLKNDNPRAAAFGVEILGEQKSHVSVPGKSRSKINGGEGTMIDFINAVADYYRAPVILKSARVDDKLTWAFTSADAVGEVSKALGARYRVTLGANNILQVEQN